MNFTGHSRRTGTEPGRNGWPRPLASLEPPLRSELFSADQMAEHGLVLARSHRLGAGRAADRLLDRLAENETALVGVCNLLTAAVSQGRQITPAGEWLLDNFHLVEEQIRTARRHLPKGYIRELPHLAQASAAGHPRVYDIALETIAHGDGRVDAQSLSRFVAAYQTVTALRIGELWAIPIMLRLAVIENLRRIAVRIGAGWAERDLADVWADRMTQAAEQDPKSLILVVADMARSDPPMVGTFVAELARRLQGRGPALALPLSWIEQRLAEAGLTIAQLVQSENQQQAADQVSISNSIGSLRVLGALEWRDFVENLSVIDQTLRHDPADVYRSMDFATRDRYRHAVEAMAKKSAMDEGEVARQAIELARTAAVKTPAGADARAWHVGYYLIDAGRAQLERAVQVRRSPLAACRALGRSPLPVYLGGIVLLTALVTAVLLRGMPMADLPRWAWAPIGVLAVLAASQLAGALVNWFSSLLVTPQPLPRMDFSEGIPPQVRTLVVVPTLLTSTAGIEELVEALEVRFLANRDAHLHFGLLTDFADAQQETLPEDQALLQLAEQRIAALNQKYARGGDQPRGDRFFLFHRPRRWNPREGCWMGYERKRGKLADLNALLRGASWGSAGDAFVLVAGDTAELGAVQYVITLDTDTQLPRDAARQLVGAMAHPLNRPRYDAAKRRVMAGYGILQPRVAASLPGANRSRYAQLFSGEAGIDPYTRAVSDVYQDLFGEGSFIGKGIYDVDAFEQTLGGRFPDDRILSHDLLEGCYARSGLLSDVQLYEDYPARYSLDVSRRRRWIRGDWQLAGWLRRRVPGPPGAPRERNPLSALSQWKLLDNLRRSLVPAALTLLLLPGWALGSPGFWSLAVIAILALPTLCATLLDLCRKPDEVLWRQHLAAVGRSAARRLAQVAFELACLPYEAAFSLDAIARTLWRMLVTRRRLLEWNPSSEVDRQLARSGGSDLAASVRAMWVAPAIALASAGLLLATRPAASIAATPILLLWLASPAIAWWISRPRVRREPALTTEQTRFLRALARRTWAFFDTFVGPEDHWLPPDNVQDNRADPVAHRTSPTNIGLALLANLSAYDFGYLTAGQLILRTGNTLRTLDGLERYRGHFYNWYDTRTLQPLHPRYVSSVDSGNLAGHLLTLRPGLLALADDRLLPARLFEGLRDTLEIVADATAAAARQLAGLRRELDSLCAAPPGSLAALRSSLEGLATRAAALASAGSGEAAPDDEARIWAEALAGQCRAAQDDLMFLAPWLALPELPAATAPAFGGLADDPWPDLTAIPTLRELAILDGRLAARIAAAPEAAQREALTAALGYVRQGSERARERIATLEALARQAGEFARLDYDFLFDKARNLLTIGYNVDERRLDSGYYDLLASEARLCCFIAIAQGQLPQDSWFALGRLLTGTTGAPTLLSWSGSMFEYLMPLLVMPSYENSLLDQTCQAAVARQIEYGKQRGVAWGMSESGYNTVDAQLNYQYRAFGVPGLGLKRGLAEDLVIAPYASVMALMVAPEAACLNLQRLAAEGTLGRFGFFEAIDYTPARQRRGQSSTLVRSFMAHHQGMSLLALAYLLLNRPMQRRFVSEPMFRAVLLLLQERVPQATALFPHTAQLSEVRSTAVTAEVPIRVFGTADTPLPQVQLLSNGRYHVMVSNAGGGYSRWQDLAVTRWREDGTCDNWGSFCYLRDLASGAFWSTTHQPTGKRAQRFEAIFSEGRAEFRRRDAVGSGAERGQIETHTDIVVSPEDDIELRRVRITNRSRQSRQIELTSYAEVVIAPAAADALHPAFSNLFVQTELLPERRAILCTRRPRAHDERPPWMFHLMVVRGEQASAPSFETDRLRFIGRTRSPAAPLAMSESGALSGSAGSVLDPIVAIRRVVSLEPEQSVTVDIVSGVAESRDWALGLVDKYQDRYLADRVFELSWTHSQVVLRQLNASEADAQLYARLASAVIYADDVLRADPAVLIRNRRGQSGLWGYAISGDLPIVLLQIGDAANMELVRQLVQAHAYWRQKGLAVDLVIWNEDHAGYRQQLHDQIMGLIASGTEASVIDRPGGIFVRSAEQISAEDRILFQAVARAVIADDRGSLAEQLGRRGPVAPRPPRLVPSRAPRPETGAPIDPALTRRDLILANGLGG
ncbi:glucoamylase family protein, partial [Immundisolibacter sp.]|uniref:glucoamylase family protein n=1 Tax=Immundisolibacter sp. TaxID=1934948 RepID=UPI003A5C06FA